MALKDGKGFTERGGAGEGGGERRVGKEEEFPDLCSGGVRRVEGK